MPKTKKEPKRLAPELRAQYGHWVCAEVEGCVWMQPWAEYAVKSQTGHVYKINESLGDALEKVFSRRKRKKTYLPMPPDRAQERDLEAWQALTQDERDEAMFNAIDSLANLL